MIPAVFFALGVCCVWYALGVNLLPRDKELPLWLVMLAIGPIGWATLLLFGEYE